MVHKKYPIKRILDLVCKIVRFMFHSISCSGELLCGDASKATKCEYEDGHEVGDLSKLFGI
jgi:hypothetical protein